jgi:hypothetical protein
MNFDPCTARSEFQISTFSLSYWRQLWDACLFSLMRLIARRALATTTSSASASKLDGLVSAYWSASLHRASNSISSSSCRLYISFVDRSMLSSRQALRSFVNWFATMMACCALMKNSKTWHYTLISSISSDVRVGLTPGSAAITG